VAAETAAVEERGEVSTGFFIPFARRICLSDTGVGGGWVRLTARSIPNPKSVEELEDCDRVESDGGAPDVKERAEEDGDDEVELVRERTFSSRARTISVF
jgi:hypothetical protein